MRHLTVALLVMVTAASLVLAGCSQPAPPPAPTSAPAKPAEPTKAAAPAPAPTKATEPTKAPAPQPTAAPKVDYPQKGKAISLVVGFAAGGPIDVMARVLAAGMEKDLGTPVQVINKEGASSQVGATEVARAKPDGYTMLVASLPTVIVTYVDTSTKAVYGRKDFIPTALYVEDSMLFAVRADSPYKTAKDLVDAAKAQPAKITISVSGLITTSSFAVSDFEAAAGIKLAKVQLGGGAPTLQGVLGGHVDIGVLNGSAATAAYKSGQIRILGVFDQGEENRFYPGVKSMAAQGYKVYARSTNGLAAPAGTPKEIVDLLAASVKRVLDNEDTKKKTEELGIGRLYMDPTQFTAWWGDQENYAIAVVKKAKEQQK